MKEMVVVGGLIREVIEEVIREVIGGVISD